MKRKLSDEERQVRRERERAIVKASIEQLRSSDAWRAWLEGRGRFHRYSFHNQLLIAWQSQWMLEKGWVDRPPKHVAGFGAWIKLGYSVCKRPDFVPEGQWGMKIWGGRDPSKKEVEQAKREGRQVRRRFYLVTVFGDNQVEPLAERPQVPLEPPIRELEGDDLAGAWVPLENLAAQLGYPMSLGEVQGDGYFDLKRRVIVVNETIGVNQRVLAAVHELAHALVRVEPDGEKFSYAREERVAELVAFTVTRTLGLEGNENSIGYLAYWLDGRDVEQLEEVAATVDRLARRIEDALPDGLVSTLKQDREEVAT